MDWNNFLREISEGIRGLDWLANQKLLVKDQLTPCEIKVLKAMLPTSNSLLSIKEMHVELGTGENTIRTHRGKIFSKLKVKNATELQINLANQFKLLDSPDTLWKELLEQAEYTGDKIKVEIVPTDSKRNHRKFEEKEIPIKIKTGFGLFIHIYPERQGDLILLERDNTGEIYCLSSLFMPNNKVDGNRNGYKIPQGKKPIYANAPGKTLLLAVVVSNVSELSWLEDARSDKFIVKGEHLNSILNSASLIMESFHTEFLVC
jgi:DNA-binding CsgD family transcriptional regulator